MGMMITKSIRTELFSGRRVDLDLIFGLFLAYVYATSFFCLFFTRIGFYDVFFVSIVFLSMLSLSFRQGVPLLRLDKNSLVPLSIVSALIVAFAVYITYAASHGRYVWLDEYTQFMSTDRGSIASFAAFQQQPPMDYFFSKFSRLVLGNDVFAVKFHAVAFFC